MTTEWSNLDHDRLIQRMGDAARRIMIIEIWTGLLDDQRFHRDFLPMVSRALKRGVQVTIYLNHPDSDVAKERTAQLVTINVRNKILLNLGRLRDYIEDDDNTAKVRNLRVLVGHLHPDIQVYCWDDRALLTFYSTDRPTYDIPQIETHVTNTPWGIFVDKKLETLARDDRIDSYALQRVYGKRARVVKQAFRDKYGIERETMFELVGLDPAVIG